MNEIRMHIPQPTTRPSFGNWEEAKSVSDALQAIEVLSKDAVRIADEVRHLDDKEGVDYQDQTPGHIFILNRTKQVKGIGFAAPGGQQSGGHDIKQDVEVVYDTKSGELSTVRVRQNHPDGNQEELQYVRENGVQSFLFSNNFGMMSAKLNEQTGATAFERVTKQPEPPAEVATAAVAEPPQPLVHEPEVGTGAQAMVGSEIWMLAN